MCVRRARARALAFRVSQFRLTPHPSSAAEQQEGGRKGGRCYILQKCGISLCKKGFPKSCASRSIMDCCRGPTGGGMPPGALRKKKVASI